MDSDGGERLTSCLRYCVTVCVCVCLMMLVVVVFGVGVRGDVLVPEYRPWPEGEGRGREVYLVYALGGRRSLD